MNRIGRQSDAEAIAYALGLIPPKLRRWVEEADWVCRLRPGFIGLHDHATHPESGRSYDSTAHVAYPHNQRCKPASARKTTIVLPGDWAFDPGVIIHESGHVIHERLRWEPWPEPVTEYAQTDRMEAFAEAFTAWICPPDSGYDTFARDLLHRDPATVTLFEVLAA